MTSVRRNNKFIKITPTGWANIKEYISVVEGEYIVPYSSHSNYREIEQFVNSLRPAVLKCVVRENRSNYQKVSNVKQFNSYMFTLQSLKQSGYELLLKKYTGIDQASESYMSLMKPGVMEEISKRLGLKISQTKIFEEDSRRFDLKMAQIIKAKNRNKLNKGAKLKRPEDNEELTKEDVEFIRECQKAKESQQIDSNTSNQNENKENNEESYSKPLTKVKLNPHYLVEKADDDETESEKENLEKKPESDDEKPAKTNGVNHFVGNTDFDDEFK